MADTAHNTLRRDFLKGMMVTGAFMPLAGAAVAHAVPDVRARWNAALADYQAKKAWFENVDQSDAALDRYCEAIDQLVATHAPDGRALQLKLELIAARNEDAFDDYRLLAQGFAQLKRDVVLFAGEAA